MKKFKVWLALGFLLITQLSQAQVELTVERLADCDGYQVSLRSTVTYNSPFNLTSSGQVTLLVPTGSVVPGTLTSINGAWNLGSPIITAPPENPGFDYIVFQLNSSTVAIPYQAGQTVPLFSFLNTGTCTGAIQLIDHATDPFLPPNSLNANIGNSFPVLGAAGEAYTGNFVSGPTDCCTSGTTTSGGNTGTPDCLIEYVLEQLGPDSFQVCLIPDTTWTGNDAITSTAQVTIRVPTASFAFGNLYSCINSGLSTEVTWSENSRYIAPLEAPTWDYYSIGLSGFTANIPYQKGVKIPLFKFTNVGSCFADSIYLIDNATDPLMLPNSQGANIDQQITVSGWQMGDVPICISADTDAACCDCGTTTATPPPVVPPTDCLIEYILEQLGPDSFQVCLISDTTWLGNNAITGTAQVSIRVPTGGFIFGNLINCINPGLATEVLWFENSRYLAPSEAPNWDYYSIGLAGYTANIPYQKGLKIPLFKFTNIGTCPADSIFLIQNETDPFMGPNSENANIEQQITVSGWQMEDVPICISQATDAACCRCGSTLPGNPPPLFSANTACSGSVTQFTDQTSPTNIVSWYWDFGDGVGSSTLQHPTYTYASSGNYTVTLMVVYSNNEVQNVSNLISICAPTPGTSSDPLFTCNIACLGDLTLFSNMTSSTNVQSWYWDFGDVVGTSNLLNPTYTYSQEGTYTVILIVTYNDNTQKSFSKEVVVHPMIWPLVRTSKDSVCIGDCVRLQAQGGTVFNWSNAATLDDPNYFSPVACPTTTTTYTVTISNTDGCTAAESVTVYIKAPPTVNAGNDLTVCLGDSIQLAGSASGNFQWNPVHSILNPAVGTPIAFPTTTTEYCLTSTDSNGCFSRDCMTVTVIGGVTANAGSDVEICSGNSTNLSASGGGTYQWSPSLGLSASTIPNPIANPTTTTTYCVTVTDNEGCMDEDCMTVVVNNLIGGINQDVSICTGNSATLTATGGVSYNWSPTLGLSNPTTANPVASPSVTTEYCVTITDANGCTEEHCTTVILASNLTVNAGSDVAICQNESITLSASGGSVYQWSPSTGLSNSNVNNPVAAPTSTTTYCVTVSDANGCTDVDCVNIIVGNSVTANAGGDQFICVGGTTQLFASGGNQYRWSPSIDLSNSNVSNPTASPTATTTYCVTVTDDNGCTDSDCMVVTIGNNINANAGDDVSICDGGDIQLFATGGSTYLWSPSTGLSNPTIRNPIASPTSTRFYCVTVTDGNGCTDADCVRVAVENNITVSAGSDQSVCAGTQAQLNATGGASYRWSPSTGLSNSNIPNPTATNDFSTTYCVTVTDVNGCTGQDCMSLNILKLHGSAGEDRTICNGSSIQLNATGGTNYTWLPSTGLNNPNIANPIANPSVTTNYCVTFSADGCMETECVTVIVGSDLTANAGTDQTICSGSSVQLSASGGLSYRWSPSTGLSNSFLSNPTANPSSTTTYCVTVTDASGCTGIDCVIVSVGNNLTANAGTDQTICSGNSVQLSASGGTSYRWSPSTGLSNAFTSSPTANPSSTTTYCVTVTDASGCTGVDCVIVNVGDNRTANAGTDQTICSGSSVQLSASGGTSYRWSPSTGLNNSFVSNPTANPSNTTTYCVTVTDASGCTGTDCVIVSVGNNLTANAGVDRTTCSGSSVQLSASGGTSYRWSPSTGLSNSFVSNPTANPSSTTTYCVTVTDASGCTGTDCMVVTLSNNISPNAGVDQTTCAGMSVQLNAGGGTSYVWSPTNSLNNAFVRNPVANPISTTTYCVTVTDANGCTGVDCTTVSISSIITTNAGNDATICNGNPTQLNAFGGLSYQWGPTTGLSNPNISNPFANPSSNTIYCVTITDGIGCTGVDCVQVNVGGSVQAEAGVDAAICAGSSTQLSASGGVAYQWSPTTGLSNPSIANPIASSNFSEYYCVTVTDANGCTDTDCVTVSVLKLHGSAGVDQTVCRDEQTQLLANGGVTYQWTPTTGLSNPNIGNPYVTASVTTTYCVTFSADGCSETDCMLLTVDPSCSDGIDEGSTPVFPCNPGVLADACIDKFICLGESTQLIVNGGTNWVWSPSTGLNNIYSEAPIANPNITTSYSVTVTDVNGCTDVDQVLVTVDDNCGNTNPSSCISIPGAIACEDKSICPNESVKLTVTTGTSYQWMPANSLDNPFLGTPTARPTATTTYFVTVTDVNGCTSTDQVNIFVRTNCEDSTPPITCSNPPRIIACEDKAICAGGNVRLTVNSGASYIWSPSASLDDAHTGAPLATPTSTTTYTVTLTDRDGCTGTDEVIVHVITVNVNAGIDQQICNGSSVQLRASGGTSYRWSPINGLSNPSISNPIATPLSTTTYCVTATDIDGCIASDCMQVSVGNGFPAVACEDKNICRGGSIQLTVTNGISYQWFPTSSLSNANTGAPIASPSTTTTYFVTVTDAGGCTSIDDVIVNVDPTCVGGRTCPEDILPNSVIAQEVASCDLFGELCLPIEMDNLDAYVIALDEVPLDMAGISSCQLSYAFAYTYFTVPDRGARGPYELTNWVVNGQSHIGKFNNIQELVTLMNQIDAVGNWELDASTLTIKGGQTGVSYSSMSVEQVQTNAIANLELNTNISPSETKLILPTGSYELSVFQKESGCMAKASVSINCPESIVACPSIFGQREMNVQLENCNEEVEVCLNIPLTEAINYSFQHNGQAYQGEGGLCTTNNNTAIYLGYGNHELIVINNQTGCADTLLVKASCTMNAIHIAKTIAVAEAGMYCIDIDESQTIKSIENVCPSESGIAVNFSMAEHCILFEGMKEGMERVCIVLCDNFEICDTTYLWVQVVPLDGLQPTAGEDDSETNANVDVSIDVVSNDRAVTAIDHIRIIKEPKYGEARINEDNTVTYIPATDYCDSEKMDYFTYEICNGYGCAIAPVNVKVKCMQPKVYSGFSPNGDGINDTFRIDGLLNFPNNELKIYNRWGTLIYQQEKYDNSWEGTYLDSPLPDGVYFYLLHDGVGSKISGYLQISR